MSQKNNKRKQNDTEETRPSFYEIHKSRIWTGVFLGIILVLFIVNNSGSEPENGPYPPNYSEQTSEMLQLSDLKGKVVLLDFWATWCPPCRRGIPDLIALKEEYKTKGVEIVGISLDAITRGTQNEVVPFIKRYGINYPILTGNSRVTQSYGGVRSIPTSFVIDPEGKVISRYVGLVSKETLVRDINKALDKKHDNSSAVDAPNFSLPVVSIN